MNRRTILTVCGTFLIGVLAGVLLMINVDANGAIKQALNIGTNNAIGGSVSESDYWIATLEVSGISPAVSVDDLAAWVKPYVPIISSRIAVDRVTGQSKGYGYVEVPRDKMKTVISALNGAEWGGRIVTVKEASQRTDLPQLPVR